MGFNSDFVVFLVGFDGFLTQQKYGDDMGAHGGPPFDHKSRWNMAPCSIAAIALWKIPREQPGTTHSSTNPTPSWCKQLCHQQTIRMLQHPDKQLLPWKFLPYFLLCKLKDRITPHVNFFQEAKKKVPVGWGRKDRQRRWWRIDQLNSCMWRVVRDQDDVRQGCV